MSNSSDGEWYTNSYGVPGDMTGNIHSEMCLKLMNVHIMLYICVHALSPGVVMYIILVSP